MTDTPQNARIGIVGLGGMGTAHAGNVREFGHELVAGADVSPAVRESFEDRFDVPTYETHEELYVEADLDGVFVTTPNRFHAPATIDALERDLHVLCEKPLAHTLADAERIVDAEANSAAFCTVGFHNRFKTPAALFAAQRDAGRFGDVTHVEANYVRRRGIPGVGSWFTDRDLAGGGALIDIGVHALDLALYAMDFPEVVEVSGVTRSEFGPRETYADPDGFAGNWDQGGDTFDVDDSATALIRCADRRTISLDVAWASNRDPSTDFEVHGTDAGAAFSLHDDELRILDTGTEGVEHYADTELTGSPKHAGHAAQDELFLESVAADDAPSINTAVQGLAVQRVLDAIYRSSERGTAVRLDDVEGDIEETEYVTTD